MGKSIRRSSSWDGRSVYLLHSHTKSLHVFRKSFMCKYERFTSLRGWFDVTWWSHPGIKTAAHPPSGLLSIFNIKKMSIWVYSKSDFHPRTLRSRSWALPASANILRELESQGYCRAMNLSLSNIDIESNPRPTDRSALRFGVRSHV